MLQLGIYQNIKHIARSTYDQSQLKVYLINTTYRRNSNPTPASNKNLFSPQCFEIKKVYNKAIPILYNKQKLFYGLLSKFYSMAFYLTLKKIARREQGQNLTCMKHLCTTLLNKLQLKRSKPYGSKSGIQVIGPFPTTFFNAILL